MFGIDELSKKEVQADSSGRMSFPLVGVVSIVGKTTQEIEGILTARLRQTFVRDPQVSVNLVDTVSQIIAVDGEVEMPDLYPVVGPMTLVRAIAKAQGLSDIANSKNVVVFRTSKGQ